MTPRKEKALRALLTCKTKREAAEQAGLSEKTLWKYMHTDEEFMERYSAACRDLVADASRQAKQALSPAITALQAILEDPEANDSSKIAASRALIEAALKLTEVNDILGILEGCEG